METRRFFLALAFCASAGFNAAADTRSSAFAPEFKSYFRLPRVSYKWPFPKGSGWMNLQTPLAFTAYPNFGRVDGLPPVQVSFEYSFDPHFSIGGYLGRYRANILDWYQNEPYKTSFWSNSGGIRMSVHFADLLNAFAGTRINLKKIDLYATGSLGWYTRNFTTVSERYRSNRDYSFGSYSAPGLMLGIRYFPVEKLGIFAEGGWGPVSLFGIGISGRLF